VPAHVVPDVDPTGAGDVFAAAFVIALWRGKPALEAVRFAHAAASFVVEAPGASGIPTEERIRGRLREAW
jgi:sugar/nucleoside kinase (ribokinase family)